MELSRPRAISRPAPGACLAVVIVRAAALGFDLGIDAVGDDLVRAACLMLVDQGGPFAVVAHPGHQILDPGPARSSKGVTGVPQIMEVHALGPDRPRWYQVSRSWTQRDAGSFVALQAGVLVMGGIW